MAKINHSLTSKALFKNTGIIAIGQVSTKLINFFLLPLYTAILSKEEYGLVDLLSTYSSLIVVIVGLQISQAAFRFLTVCREDENKTTEVVSTIVVSTGAAIVLYIAVFIGVAPFINLQFKWYLVLHVAVVLFLQTMSCITRGFGRNAYYAMGNFISAATSLVLNVITIAVLRWGIGAMLAAYIIGPLVGGSFLFVKTRFWKYVDLKKVSKKELRTIITYAFPLVPNELSWSVIHVSDRMVISAFLGVAANGLIAVATKFSTIYTTAFSIFNTSWTEQVVLHYRDEGGPEYICDMFDRMVTFFCCVAIGIVACMPLVFHVMVNVQFSEAYNLIPFYMTAVFFNAIIGMISAIYLVEDETKRVAASTMAAAAINLAVDVGLVKIIGMYAAPISSICGYAVISVWRLYDVNKRHCRVVMPLKKIVFLSINVIITIFCYYSGNLGLQILALLLIIAISYVLNRHFLLDIGKMISKKWRKK